MSNLRTFWAMLLMGGASPVPSGPQPPPPGHSHYLHVFGGVILLPQLPASTRTIVLWVRGQAPLENNAFYLVDNRTPVGGNGGGYFASQFRDGVTVYVNGQVVNSIGLEPVLNGAWNKVVLEFTAWNQPTFFGRYSWTDGGSKPLLDIDVADMRAYSRSLTGPELASSGNWPTGEGLLLRYDFFNLSLTPVGPNGYNGTLPDISGNGYDAQIGTFQNSPMATENNE